MTLNRRQVIGGAIAAFPASLTQQRRPEAGVCSGFVRGSGGPWTVELKESDGAVRTATTDGDGWYRFKEPANNPYLLTFRDRSSNIVREVRWLTEKVSQTVSVTIDTSLKNFDSAYGALQAIESLVAFAQAYPAARPNVARTDVTDTLRRVRDVIGALPAAGFLEAKAKNIEELIRTTLG